MLNLESVKEKVAAYKTEIGVATCILANLALNGVVAAALTVAAAVAVHYRSKIDSSESAPSPEASEPSDPSSDGKA